MRRPILPTAGALLTLGLLVACTPQPADPGPADQTSGPPSETLRDTAPEGMVIGVAVAGGGHNLQTDFPNPFMDDPEYREVLATQFSSVTAENQMKWELIHPRQDTYDFEPADAIVEFAEENGQDVRGHTLLWHSQNPTWLENGDFTPDELRDILREHIETVVGRYAGRIDQWDVANEVIDDDGQLRTQDNIWIRELGVEIIADAFRWAHEADPDALLFLNDYNAEWIGPKSDAYLELATELLADGVPLHGFGVQGHLSTEYNFPGDMAQNLQRFADLGLVTAVTEADVRMKLPPDGVPTEAQLEEQADYYRRALEACLDVDGCDSFTVWGLTDRYSWVPYFFSGEGAATLLTEDHEAKPAFHALLAALAG